MNRTKTLAPGHRVSVRGAPVSTGKWIQDPYIALAADDVLTVTRQDAPPPPPPPPPDPMTRPFPAPVTTLAFQAPAPTGGDDHTSLNNFLDATPDGSVLVFNGKYRLSQGLMIGSRKNLVFQLGSSEFYLTGDRTQHTSSAFIPGYRRNYGFVGGAEHLSFIGGVVIGTDPNPGAGQPLRGENNHAIRCSGARWVEATGMTVRAVSGDHFFGHFTDDVWAHHNTIETAGRNGHTVISGKRVLVEDSTYLDCGYCTFDIEPNYATEPSYDITFRRIAVGKVGVASPWQDGIGLLSVDGGARGADIQRVRLEDVTVIGKVPQVYIDNKGATARMKDVTVVNVKGPAGGTIRIIDVDGVVAYGNSAPVTTTGSTNVRLTA